MTQAAYDALCAQAVWHESAMQVILAREGRRRATGAALDAAYYAVLAATFSFVGTMEWLVPAMSWGACWLAGGIAFGKLLTALARLNLGSPTAQYIGADFGVAVRVYLARKLQGAVHGSGIEGNLAEAERDRRRLGLPDIPKEGGAS